METDKGISNVNLNDEDITRCLECNLICLIRTKYKKGQLYINYKCENGHSGEKLFQNYLKEYKFYSLYNEKCKCGKCPKDDKNNFFYCSKCKMFLCNICQNKHPNGDKHDVINYKRYDSLCTNHSNFFDSYCIECEKNICSFCRKEVIHKGHNFINLFDIDLSDDTIMNFRKEIEELKEKINNLDLIKTLIDSAIDDLKMLNDVEIKLREIILNTYLYENRQKNLNYYVIKNLKNCQLTNLNKIEFYNTIYNEGDIYLQKLKNMKTIQTNNFITIYNKKIINHFEQLKDGRLAICNNDNELKIYDIDTFEEEISIILHNNYINSFIQLKNGKIITCSTDNSMQIIQLNKYDYKLEQNLKGHSDIIKKVIEINENMIISISYDKTIIIWELDTTNDYHYYKTIKSINIEETGNIYPINENEFVSLEYNKAILKFWKIDDYSIHTTIKEIYSSNVNYNNNICLLDKDILGVGGRDNYGIYLIRISKYELIENITSLYSINSIIKCKNNIDDNNFFLCSGYYKGQTISIYKYKNEKLELTKQIYNAHSNEICLCIELERKNKEIIIASMEYNKNFIKLWNI